MVWKPNKSQKRAFKQRMKDPIEKRIYEERKSLKMAKNALKSKFSYPSAGGRYVPTKRQYEIASKMIFDFLTREQNDAANIVISGYMSSVTVDHDYIHIVNEYSRKNQI